MFFEDWNASLAAAVEVEEEALPPPTAYAEWVVHSSNFHSNSNPNSRNAVNENVNENGRLEMIQMTTTTTTMTRTTTMTTTRTNATAAYSNVNVTDTETLTAFWKDRKQQQQQQQQAVVAVQPLKDECDSDSDSDNSESSYYYDYSSHHPPPPNSRRNSRIAAAALPDEVERILQETPNLMERRDVAKQIRNSWIHAPIQVGQWNQHSQEYSERSEYQSPDHIMFSSSPRRRRRMSGTVLRGMAGIGKTVLAASIIADANVLRYYHDGVVWITLPSPECNPGSSLDVSFSVLEYRQYLKEIARQLKLSLLLPYYPNENGGSGSGSGRNTVEDRMHMLEAKYEMMRCLKNKRVLLVIDNVWHRKDPSWFDFWESSSSSSSSGQYSSSDTNLHVCVITRFRNITPHDEISCDCYFGIIEVPPFSLSEGIALFLRSTKLLDSNVSEIQSPQLPSPPQPEINANSNSSQENTGYGTNLQHIVTSASGLPVVLIALGKSAHQLFQYDEDVTDEETWYSFRTFLNSDDVIQTYQEEVFEYYQQIFQLHPMFARNDDVSRMSSKMCQLCLVAFCSVFEFDDVSGVPFAVVFTYLQKILSLYYPDDVNSKNDRSNDDVSNRVLEILDALEVLGFLDVQTYDVSTSGTIAPYFYTYKIHNGSMVQFAKELLCWHHSCSCATHKNATCTCLYPRNTTGSTTSSSTIRNTFRRSTSLQPLQVPSLHATVLEAIAPNLTLPCTFPYNVLLYFLGTYFQSHGTGSTTTNGTTMSSTYLCNWRREMHTADCRYFLHKIVFHMIRSNRRIKSTLLKQAEWLLCQRDFFLARTSMLCGYNADHAIQLNLADLDDLCRARKRQRQRQRPMKKSTPANSFRLTEGTNPRSCRIQNPSSSYAYLPPTSSLYDTNELYENGNDSTTSSSPSIGEGIFNSQSPFRDVFCAQMHVIRSSIPPNPTWEDAVTYHRAWITLALWLQRKSQFVMALDCLAEAKMLCRLAPMHAMAETALVDRLLSSLSVRHIILVHKNCSRRAVFDNLRQFEKASKYNRKCGRLLIQNNASDNRLLRSGVVQSAAVEQAPLVHTTVAGFGPEESALDCEYDGSIFRFQGNFGGNLCIFGDEEVCSVIQITSTKKSKCPYKNPSVLKSKFTCNINNNTISPKDRPDLVLGKAWPALIFVSRDSPCRLVFKNLQGQEQESRRNPTKSFLLGELLSHPNRSIALNGTSSYRGYLQGFLAVGPSEEMFPLMWHRGRICCQDKNYGCMHALLFSYSQGAQVTFSCYWNWAESNIISKFLFYMGFYTFSINDEGTLSPRLAPHLCVGVADAGSANEIISMDKLELAQLEASKEHMFWFKTYQLFIVFLARISMGLLCAGLGLGLVRPYTPQYQ